MLKSEQFVLQAFQIAQKVQLSQKYEVLQAKSPFRTRFNNARYILPPHPPLVGYPALQTD